MSMTETTPSTKMDLREGFCRCGCGTPTNRGSWFRQGHDARLKGNLQQALRNGRPVLVVRADASEEIMSVQDSLRFLTPELAAKVTAESTSSKARRRQPSDVEAIERLAKMENPDVEIKDEPSPEVIERLEAKEQANVAKGLIPATPPATPAKQAKPQQNRK